MATCISFQDDEDDDFTDLQETEVLSSVVSRQAKYGSTSSHSYTNQKCITHQVQPNDTLQGLALKYQVSMEQIRRANRMYATDSLYLRPTLRIPVEPDANLSNSSSASGSRTSISNVDGSIELAIVTGTKATHKDSVRNGGISHAADSVDQTKSKVSSSQEESFKDFLNRIDTSIARNKDQVQERDKKFPKSQSMDHFSSHVARSRNYRRQSLERDNDNFHPVAVFNNGSESEGPTTYVMTKGHRVKSSLKRLEREKDDLFQL